LVFQALRNPVPLVCYGRLTRIFSRVGPVRKRGFRRRILTMNNGEHYDFVIRHGRGWGTFAWKLAPSGKRILLLERGPYVPREHARRTRFDKKHQIHLFKCSNSYRGHCAFSGQRKILLKNRAQSLYKSRSFVGKKARASLYFSDPDGHLIEFITSSVGSINLLRAESSRSPVAIHRSPLSAERASSAPWHRGRESVRRPDRRAWRRGDSLRAKGRVASRSERTTCRSSGAGQAAAACQEAVDGLALPRSAA
jgi:catechol 2,3-dioxygenase-like lactoylglutathione lyase family enzyme